MSAFDAVTTPVPVSMFAALHESIVATSVEKDRQ
jgi:hypothetical protein